MLSTIDAIGQLTAPQNTHTSPSAAANPAGMPSSPPSTQPSVAPMKNVGTTSPPLNPLPMVTAVNSSFQKNASGAACPPSMARVMTSMPAPL